MAAAPRRHAGQGPLPAARRRARRSRTIEALPALQESILNSNEQYLVDVIGFNEVERSMLTSIFALAARRDPGFAQFEPGTPGRSPDIYLVDADDQAAFNEFRSLHRRAGLPAVMIGASA